MSRRRVIRTETTCDDAELARRNPDRLPPKQRVLLSRWGYPHVMEAFRFHMTLTDRLHRDDIGTRLPNHLGDSLRADFLTILPSAMPDIPGHRSE